MAQGVGEGAPATTATSDGGRIGDLEVGAVPAVATLVAAEPSQLRRPPTIAALTGLRAVAALWVVSFHYQGDVLALVPALRPLSPVMSAGYLGVDVFFVLSGFVLAYNYSGRLGTWQPRGVAAFVQNRVARVWPVQLVTLHLDLLQAAVIGGLGITAGGHRRTWSAYWQNLTMTHDWFTDRPSFNGPAWSISAEWAAYLLCPFLLLGLARVRRGATAAVLAAASFAAMLGVYLVWGLPNGNVEHGGLVRVAGEFVAGVFFLRVYQQAPAWLGRLTLPAIGGLLALVVLVPASVSGHYWLAPALGVVVLLLALDHGPLGRLLSHRFFVFGGEASYCLYMTHLLVQPVLHSMVDPASVRGAPWPVGLLVLALYAAVLALAAVLLRRFVEAPARHLMRARSR